MKIGQTVDYTNAHGDTVAARITAVAGDEPGPRVLDLAIGEQTVTGVPHVSRAAEGEPHWAIPAAG